MKFKYIRFYLFLLVSLAAGGIKAQERITFFNSAISIDTLGRLTVTETISINAEGTIFKRGIFRKIPEYRKDKNGQSIHNSIKVISVLQDGEQAEYKESSKESLLEIRIGSANKFLTDGIHKYDITYAIENQVGFFDNYDELYWNVTGSDWDFNIDSVSCVIQLPVGAAVLQQSCYTGVPGSTATECDAVYGEGHVSFTASNLSPGEGLTVAVGFTKGIVQPPPPPTFWERYNVLILAIIFLLAILGYMVYSWFNHGIDPPKPTVIPQFEVPGGLSPAKMAFYYKEQYNSDYFTISLVQLAVKGYIRITEKVTNTLFVFKDTDYVIEKIKGEGMSNLSVEERGILNSLFSGGKNIITASGTYNAKFKNALTSFEANFKEAKASVKEGSNTRLLWIPIILLIAYYLVVAYYNVSSVFMSGLTIFLLLIIPVFLSIPIVIFSTIFRLKPKWKTIYNVFFIFTTAVFIGVIFLNESSFSFNVKVVLLFTIFLVMLFLSYRFLIKQPSIERLQRQADIEGFLMYMKAAEEKQIQFANSPALTPQLFEKLLPFAMALEIDKIWGEKFKDIIQQGMQDKTYQPSWYVGSNFNTFNFHSIGNDITSTISSSSIAPSTSSSGGSSGSWSSGSSGGGSSGGGGGGGGGGGW